MSRVLNDDQFAALANTSGASRFADTGEQVRDTDHPGHFAVSFPSSRGHEQELAHPLVRQQVVEHAKRMAADPALQGVDRTMQGAWPYGGKVYLDASRLIPGRQQAVEQGRADSQIAIRDMGRARDVYINRPEGADTPLRAVQGGPGLGYTVRRKPGRVPAVRRGARVAGSRRV